MRFVYILLTFVLYHVSVHAQMHPYNTNFTVSLHNFVDTIEIEYENDQIFIPVTINGQSYRFNLDTGSSQGMIYKGSKIPIVQDLGKVVSRDANNIADTIQAVQISSFTIGRLNIDGYVASVVKVPQRVIHYDGVIGFDLFNKGIGCKIDTQKGILILSDIPKHFDTEVGYSLKYKLNWFVPYINISPFMRHVDEVLFDTGARQLYVMNKQSFLEHSYQSKQVNEQVEGCAYGNFTQGTNSEEKQDEVFFLNLNRLKFDTFSFRNIHTITTQGASRIGAQIFHYGSMVINPHKKLLLFQPYQNSDSVNVNNKQFGIAFINQDNQPAIGLIWQKTEAYKKGMRQGDILLRINGEVITSYQQFIDYKFVDGQTYKFTLHDQKGFNKEVSVIR